VCSAGYSFSISWCGEAFLEVGVQSADVLALPGALPQSSVSPASQQSPWVTEVRRSVAVSWSPFSLIYFGWLLLIPWFASNFSHSVGCFFILLIASFGVTEAF
jgi:hypothetical protein